MSKLNTQGNWYKGNLHCHTTRSDGKKTPQEIVQMYKEQQYDFLALSDHDIFADDMQAFGSNDFLILPAMEASIYYMTDPQKIEKYKNAHLTDTLQILFDEQGHPNCDRAHHINVFWMDGERPFSHLEVLPPKLIFGENHTILQETIDFFLQKGCLVTYNHPLWSRVTHEELIHTEGLSAIEVYNDWTEKICGLGTDTSFLDAMLRHGKTIHALATDDNHNKDTVLTNYGGYIMVHAKSLSRADILSAIKSGNYYSSSGMELYQWDVQNGIAKVRCSPASRIRFVVGNKVLDGSVHNAKGTPLVEATYTLKGHETYIRVECVGEDGTCAWSNAIYL